MVSQTNSMHIDEADSSSCSIERADYTNLLSLLLLKQSERRQQGRGKEKEMLPRLQYVCKLMQFSASFLLADVNECWRYPGRLCAQTCDNTPGSYQCSCTTGFSLAFDGKNCEGTSICTSRIEHRSVLPANNVLCSDSMNVRSFQLKWDTNRVKNKNRRVSCQLKCFLGDWSALFY